MYLHSVTWTLLICVLLVYVDDDSSSEDTDTDKTIGDSGDSLSMQVDDLTCIVGNYATYVSCLRLYSFMSVAC